MTTITEGTAVRLEPVFLDGIECRFISGLSDYAIGSNGSIWSRRRNGSSKSGLRQIGEWRELKPRLRQKGYLAVQVVTDLGQVKYFSIHRLVLLAFMGFPDKNLQACHNDGNNQNNDISNLRWDTAKANQDDVVRHGRRLFGSALSMAKIDESLAARILLAWQSSPSANQTELAASLGVSYSTFRNIISGYTWKHVLPEIERLSVVKARSRAISAVDWWLASNAIFQLDSTDETCTEVFSRKSEDGQWLYAVVKFSLVDGTKRPQSATVLRKGVAREILYRENGL